MLQTGAKRMAVMRSMIRRDLPQVVRIEQASYDSPWSLDDFIGILAIKTVRGFTAEVYPAPLDPDEQIAGYVVFDVCKDRLHLLSVTVPPWERRSGVGRELVACAAEKAKFHKKPKMVVDLRESELGAQLFFRAVGFRATSVERGHFEDTGEDAYRMERAV